MRISLVEEIDVSNEADEGWGTRAKDTLMALSLSMPSNCHVLDFDRG